MTSGKTVERAERLKGWNQDVTDLVTQSAPDLLKTWDLSVSKLTRADIGRKLRKVASCGGLLEMRAPLDKETGEVGDLVLHNADFCGQYAVCPICAARIQSRRQASLREPIQAFARRYAFAYMVTATIQDGRDLRERLAHLVESWQAFRRMGQKRKTGRSAGEWGKVAAALAHVEIKRGAKSGEWHPHIHALVFSDDPFDYSVWDAAKLAAGEKVAKAPIEFQGRKVASSTISRQWLRASGDSMGIDVRPLRERKTDRAHGWDRAESVWRQAREVLKYATKFNGNPNADQAALYGPDYVTVMDVTYGRRLFNSYGGFRGLAALENELVEPCDLAAGETPIVYSMRWDRGRRKYGRLRAEAGPIFDNSDPIKGERRLELVTKVNQVQGEYRARRSRIVATRPYFMRRGKLEEWERWIDKNTKACHSAIWEVRENHRVGDLNYAAAWLQARIDEERFALAYWDRYPDKEIGVTESFIWVLNHPPPGLDPARRAYSPPLSAA